ncbi:hypothetical protein SLS57_004844 [Botryosphaeria dothidea]
MTSVLAMTTLAMPNDLVVRKRQEETTALAQNLEFAIKSSSCSLLGCATVAASSVCIVGAIVEKDPVNLISCVAGDIGAVCSCSGCIDKLDTFLTEHSLC